MPRKLSRPNWVRAMSVAGAAGAVGAMTLGGGIASATEACVSPVSKKAFAHFGDTASYFLAPGGAFEGPLTWAHNASAAIVAGNEPFMLNAPTDDQSLRLRPGGTVTTPLMCITPETPHLRFVAKALDSRPLNVRVRFYGRTDDDWEVTDVTRGSVSAAGHGQWAPSRNIDLMTHMLAPGTVGYVDVKFKSQGDWQIDDVFVDPFAR